MADAKKVNINKFVTGYVEIDGVIYPKLDEAILVNERGSWKSRILSGLTGKKNGKTYDNLKAALKVRFADNTLFDKDNSFISDLNAAVKTVNGGGGSEDQKKMVSNFTFALTDLMEGVANDADWNVRITALQAEVSPEAAATDQPEADTATEEAETPAENEAPETETPATETPDEGGTPETPTAEAPEQTEETATPEQDAAAKVVEEAEETADGGANLPVAKFQEFLDSMIKQSDAVLATNDHLLKNADLLNQMQQNNLQALRANSDAVKIGREQWEQLKAMALPASTEAAE